MNTEEILLQQYNIYTNQKENFVERSFFTNKFYLVLLLLLILTMYLTKDCSFIYGITSTLVFSAAGMIICTLWWINVDSYNFLIKVKLSKVIEEIEKRLPIQPYTREFEIITDLSKRKREFLFADIQKGLAVLAFLLFLFLFSYEVLNIIVN